MIPVSAWGVSAFGCLGATVAEYLIPGLGYGFLGHYDKLLVLGGSRWVVLNKYLQYSTNKDYEKNFSKIYRKRELTDDKNQHDFFYSRETFYANAYVSMYGNLTFATFYDLYETGCEDNPETFGLMLAPFQIWEYYDEWTFWVPTVWASSVSLKSDLVTYHVDKDLSKNEMINTSFLQYAIAFAAGLYFGIIYHPADGDFDLTEPIAIHSWWDAILAHRRLKGAEFVERKEGENALNYSLRANRTYPLLGFNYRF